MLVLVGDVQADFMPGRVHILLLVGEVQAD